MDWRCPFWQTNTHAHVYDIPCVLEDADSQPANQPAHFKPFLFVPRNEIKGSLLAMQIVPLKMLPGKENKNKKQQKQKQHTQNRKRKPIHSSIRSHFSVWGLPFNCNSAYIHMRVHNNTTAHNQLFFLSVPLVQHYKLKLCIVSWLS